MSEQQQNPEAAPQPTQALNAPGAEPPAEPGVASHEQASLDPTQMMAGHGSALVSALLQRLQEGAVPHTISLLHNNIDILRDREGERPIEYLRQVGVTAAGAGQLGLPEDYQQVRDAVGGVPITTMDPSGGPNRLYPEVLSKNKTWEGLVPLYAGQTPDEALARAAAARAKSASDLTAQLASVVQGILPMATMGLSNVPPSAAQGGPATLPLLGLSAIKMITDAYAKGAEGNASLQDAARTDGAAIGLMIWPVTPPGAVFEAIQTAAGPLLEKGMAAIGARAATAVASRMAARSTVGVVEGATAGGVQTGPEIMQGVMDTIAKVGQKGSSWNPRSWPLDKLGQRAMSKMPPQIYGQLERVLGRVGEVGGSVETTAAGEVVVSIPAGATEYIGGKSVSNTLLLEDTRRALRALKNAMTAEGVTVSFKITKLAAQTGADIAGMMGLTALRAGSASAEPGATPGSVGKGVLASLPTDILFPAAMRLSQVGGMLSPTYPNLKKGWVLGQRSGPADPFRTAGPVNSNAPASQRLAYLPAPGGAPPPVVQAIARVQEAYRSSPNPSISDSIAKTTQALIAQTQLPAPPALPPDAPPEMVAQLQQITQQAQQMAQDVPAHLTALAELAGHPALADASRLLGVDAEALLLGNAPAPWPLVRYAVALAEQAGSLEGYALPTQPFSLPELVSVAQQILAKKPEAAVGLPPELQAALPKIPTALLSSPPATPTSHALPPVDRATLTLRDAPDEAALDSDPSAIGKMTALLDSYSQGSPMLPLGTLFPSNPSALVSSDPQRVNLYLDDGLIKAEVPNAAGETTLIDVTHSLEPAALPADAGWTLKRSVVGPIAVRLTDSGRFVIDPTATGDLIGAQAALRERVNDERGSPIDPFTQPGSLLEAAHHLTFDNKWGAEAVVAAAERLRANHVALFPMREEVLAPANDRQRDEEWGERISQHLQEAAKIEAAHAVATEALTEKRGNTALRTAFGNESVRRFRTAWALFDSVSDQVTDPVKYARLVQVVQRHIEEGLRLDLQREATPKWAEDAEPPAPAEDRPTPRPTWSNIAFVLEKLPETFKPESLLNLLKQAGQRAGVPITQAELNALNIPGFLAESPDHSKDALRTWIADKLVVTREHPTTEYERESLNLPGGHSYRMISIVASAAKDVEIFDPFTGQVIRMVVSEDEARAWIEGEGRAGSQLDWGYMSATSKRKFTGGHSIPNTIAHMRQDERLLTIGNDSLNALFAQEFQSDWEHEARDYVKSLPVQARLNELSNERILLNAERNAVADKYGMSHVDAINYHNAATLNAPPRGLVPDAKTAVEEAFRITREFDKIERKIDKNDQEVARIVRTQPRGSYGEAPPTHPLLAEWKELLFKRLLRAAAEKGKDAVGWTTGTQQIERYNLMLKGITSATLTQGGMVRVTKENGAAHLLTGPQEAEFYKLLGARTAEFEEAGELDFSSAPLEIGGKWAKQLYDTEMVAIANKWGKRWGVKVEEGGHTYRKAYFADYSGAYSHREAPWTLTEATTGVAVGFFATREEASVYARDLVKAAAHSTVHALRLTPEARASLINEGQPTFGFATPTNRTSDVQRLHEQWGSTPLGDVDRSPLTNADYQAAYSQRVSLFGSVIDAHAPLPKGEKLLLLDPRKEYPPAAIAALGKDMDIGELAWGLGGGFHTVQKALAEVFPELATSSVYDGFSLNTGHYGVNVPGEALPASATEAPNRILTAPFSVLNTVQAKMDAGRLTPKEGIRRFVRRSFITFIHEKTHDLERSHGDRFDELFGDALTVMAHPDVLQSISGAVERLEMNNAELFNTLLGHANTLRSLSGQGGGLRGHPSGVARPGSPEPSTDPGSLGRDRTGGGGLAGDLRRGNLWPAEDIAPVPPGGGGGPDPAALAREAARLHVEALDYAANGGSFSKRPKLFAALTPDEKYEAALARLLTGDIVSPVQLKALNPSLGGPSYWAGWKPTPDQATKLQTAWEHARDKAGDRDKALTLATEVAEKRGIARSSYVATGDRTALNKIEREGIIPFDQLKTITAADWKHLAKTSPHIYAEFIGQFNRERSPLSRTAEEHGATQTLNLLEDAFEAILENPEITSLDALPPEALKTKNMFEHMSATSTLQAMLTKISRPFQAIGSQRQLSIQQMRGAIDSGVMDRDPYEQIRGGVIDQLDRARSDEAFYDPLHRVEAYAPPDISNTITVLLHRALWQGWTPETLAQPKYEWKVPLSPLGMKGATTTIRLSEWVPKIRARLDAAHEAMTPVLIAERTHDQVTARKVMNTIEAEIHARILKHAATTGTEVAALSDLPPETIAALRIALRASDKGDDAAEDFEAMSFKELERTLASRTKGWAKLQKEIETLERGAKYRENYTPLIYNRRVKEEIADAVATKSDPYLLQLSRQNPDIFFRFLEERTENEQPPIEDFFYTNRLYNYGLNRFVALQPRLTKALDLVSHPDYPVAQRDYTLDMVGLLKGIPRPEEALLENHLREALLKNPSLWKDILKKVKGIDADEVVKKYGDRALPARASHALTRALLSSIYTTFISLRKTALFNLAEIAYILPELAKNSPDLLHGVVDIPIAAAQALGARTKEFWARRMATLFGRRGWYQYQSEATKAHVTDLVNEVNTHLAEASRITKESGSASGKRAALILDTTMSLSGVKPTEAITRTIMFNTLVKACLRAGLTLDEAHYEAAKRVEYMQGAFHTAAWAPVFASQNAKLLMPLQRYFGVRTGPYLAHWRMLLEGMSGLGPKRKIGPVAQPEAELPPLSEQPPLTDGEREAWHDVHTPPAEHGTGFAAGSGSAMRAARYLAAVHLTLAYILWPIGKKIYSFLGLNPQKAWDYVDPYFMRDASTIFQGLIGDASNVAHTFTNPGSLSPKQRKDRNMSAARLAAYGASVATLGAAGVVTGPWLRSQYKPKPKGFDAGPSFHGF